MGDASPERAPAREKPIPMGELDHLADRSVDLEAILPWRRT
jgi:hypothetical protein